MDTYIVTVYNCFSDTSYILGTYSSIEMARKAIDIEFENVGTFIDWDVNFINETLWFFYDSYIVEIQRTILDDNMDC